MMPTEKDNLPPSALALQKVVDRIARNGHREADLAALRKFNLLFFNAQKAETPDAELIAMVEAFEAKEVLPDV